MLTDFPDATHDLELSDLIDGVDVVNPLVFVQIPLMYRINANIPRLAIGPGFATFANL